eukprot:TRINITY_DN12580_c0_g1_i3.p1 TRINITY_DN12580_c0_g1~~TRINITY_DN12580_c0_g1_i3.p1  ORF type:complete len:278 (-),score=41.59 TRINITY_DN12580_c0_g1_i3:43-876(-)
MIPHRFYRDSVSVPDPASRPLSALSKVIFGVHLVLVILGICLLAVAGWSKNSTETPIVQKPEVLNRAFAAGALALVTGLVGLFCVYQAHVVEDDEKAYRMLMVVLALELTLLIFVVFSAKTSVTQYDDMKQARDSRQSTVATIFENVATRNALSQPDAWLAVQQQFNCCGFRNLTGPLATGPLCPFNFTGSGFRNSTSGWNRNLRTCRYTILNEALKSTLGMVVLDCMLLFLGAVAILSMCLLLRRTREEKLEHAQSIQYDTLSQANRRANSAAEEP